MNSLLLRASWRELCLASSYLLGCDGLSRSYWREEKLWATGTLLTVVWLWASLELKKITGKTDTGTTGHLRNGRVAIKDLCRENRGPPAGLRKMPERGAGPRGIWAFDACAVWAIWETDYFLLH